MAKIVIVLRTVGIVLHAVCVVVMLTSHSYAAFFTASTISEHQQMLAFGH